MSTDDYQAVLLSHRQTIDNLDAALIYILAERFRCTHKVGELKAVHNMPESDKNREAVQLTRLKEIAKRSGLDVDFMEEVMRKIIDEVVRRHEKLKA